MISNITIWKLLPVLPWIIQLLLCLMRILISLVLNSRIEAAKFEPEATLEKTINYIKIDNLKSITSITMNLSAIALNKPSSSSEHQKSDLVPWIILQSPVRSPQFTKHLSSMHTKGKNQLQIQKRWVTLRSAFIYPFFCQTFVNASQWLFPAQDIQFFYTRSHLRSLQNCAFIFSTNFQFIFTFK